MLILILIDVQSSQKAVFSSQKGWNCQDHSSSGSLCSVKNLPPPLAHLSKISDPHPPTPFTTIWKTQAVISVDAYPFWLSRT